MKRFVVCKKYGNGGDPDILPWTPTTGPYRPAIMDVMNPQTGKRAFNVVTAIAQINNRCLVLAAGADFTLINGNADCDQIPDLSLDSTLSVLQNNVYNNIINKLTARGYNVSSITKQSTVRQLIDLIGKDADPAFSVDKFDVSE
jgi:hypothetical protein